MLQWEVERGERGRGMESSNVKKRKRQREYMHHTLRSVSLFFPFIVVGALHRAGHPYYCISVTRALHPHPIKAPPHQQPATQREYRERQGETAQQSI
jgi:hypothetical protein